MIATAVIDRRYNGPAGSANGGYACGVFAAAARELLADADVTVTLHAPVPLDTELRVVRDGRRAHVWRADELLATVAPAAAGRTEPVGFLAPAAAAEVAAGFPGHAWHPFPACFVCGAESDGLALRPGPIPGRPDEFACAWRPDASVAEPDGRVPAAVAVAALDCPGGWTAIRPGRPMVLSRMTAQVVERPVAEVDHVVVARLDNVDGRVAANTTMLYRADGALLGWARSVWLEVPEAGP